MRFVVRLPSGVVRVVRARDEQHARVQAEVIARVLAPSCSASQAIAAHGA